MAAVGVNLMTWMALAAEWQRDWARADTAIAYLWEQQLLNTPVPSTTG